MARQTAQRVDTLSRDELTQIQSEKLRLMLEEIYGRNYFYTRKLDDANVRPQDISTLDDLGKLPFTIKSELAADQDRDGFAANLTYPLKRYIRFHQTSGTTGRPLRVLDTPESWDWWGDCWARGLAGTGITAEGRIFCAFSFGPFIGFWASVVGARQIGAFGFESQSQRNRLSIIETEFIAEVIDPVSGEQATEGNTGELVLTNLGRWGFPVIRYRTGDAATVSSSTSIDAGFMSSFNE